jgi:hypothetical protein
MELDTRLGLTSPGTIIPNFMILRQWIRYPKRRETKMRSAMIIQEASFRHKLKAEGFTHLERLNRPHQTLYNYTYTCMAAHF